MFKFLVLFFEFADAVTPAELTSVDVVYGCFSILRCVVDVMCLLGASIIFSMLVVYVEGLGAVVGWDRVKCAGMWCYSYIA